MAQTVSKNDSPGRVERAGRRHVRMTKRTKNEQAIAIAQRIEAPRLELRTKMDAAAGAEEAVEDRYDDWLANDRVVDDLIYSVHRKAVDYDADHPGARTETTLFQGERPSNVTYTNREDQPDVVVKIIERAGSLPPEHPALPVIPQLVEANDQSRASHKAYEAAQTAEVQAKAAVEIAKLAMIAVYRDNVIDMTRAVGEQLTERCFPQLRTRRRRSTVEVEQDGDDSEG